MDPDTYFVRLRLSSGLPPKIAIFRVKRKICECSLRKTRHTGIRTLAFLQIAQTKSGLHACLAAIFQTLNKMFAHKVLYILSQVRILDNILKL